MSLSKSKVYFFYQGVKSGLQSRTKLKKFIELIFKKEGRPLLSINYIFCTDKALLEINKQFLKHDFYTDIITFDLSESDEIAAEIYISVDRVRDNASLLGVSFKSELHRVIFHGALHLCGYSDKTKDQKAEMRGKEDFYLLSYLKKK
ncbi:MAG: rRNA maturation RNase YbeY [Chitinophagaceae bacterium]|nr:rRNA maturation RNase YbeY [Chitinophagaceae bacterium]MBP9102642.1 rRNA maturation RNase YbeY [Chitinophagaceae bacterium]